MKTKLTKKFYVPGLISAILIPLVFWYLGNRKLNEPIQNVMDLGIPAKYNPNIPLNEQFTFESFRYWNYKKIIVKPGTAKQNSELYVSEIKKMQKRNEKNSGIEFVLDDQNSYNDFVSILNDMAIAKHEIYGVDLDKTGHFFALVDYKDVHEKPEQFESLLSNDVFETYIDERSIIEKLLFPDIFVKYINLAKTLTNESIYLIFGFLLFLIAAMLNIRKFL